MKYCVMFLFSICVIMLSSYRLHAEITRDYAVLAHATVQNNPPSIVLQWPAHSDAISYTLYKKLKRESSWGDILTILPGTATGFTDSDVLPAIEYEYKIDKKAKLDTETYHGYGYLCSGIEVPAVDHRGTLILMVDATYSDVLSSEITRLEQDIIGDGWKVIRHNVGRSDAVESVKNLIVNDYKADPVNVEAVFLLGHVPVPYSGNINPDGHPDHLGAWPADVYYGDMDGIWTDAFVHNDTSSPAKRTQNVPGDGKFDQSSLPSDVELQVGRVDLVNMPQFTLNDTLLIKTYLDRDHAYRHKLFTAEMRGLIDDNWGPLGGEAFACTAWRTFSSIMGVSAISDNVSDAAVDYIPALQKGSYLWSYGCGPGSVTGCSGVTTIIELSQDTIHTVFTGLFGSWFGDWDAENDLMRATLASKVPALTCYWGGRPHWYLHHMALGETIGYGARLSQNNSGLYFPSIYAEMARSIHIALMGDPTLRTHVVAPPGGVTVQAINTSVQLNWTPSPESVLGYYVFQAPNLQSPFVRISPQIISSTTFVDNCPLPGNNVYMVRAVTLQTSASGSYYNMSEGMISQPVSMDAMPALTSVSLLDPGTLSYCSGDTIHVAISGTGPSCTGNTYTLQLSDTNGTFAGYTNLNTISGVHEGVIAGRVPATISGGTHYRVRVVSTIPISTAQDNGTDLSIFGVPDAQFSYKADNGVVTFTNASSGATSYFWDFGDKSTDTAQSPVHAFMKTGLHKVKLIATNKCSSDTLTRNVIVTITDVAESDMSDHSTIIVYPNPNNGIFYLVSSLQSIHPTEVRILDALGREVYRKTMERATNLELSVDLSLLAKGVYSVQVNSEGRTAHTMVICR